MADDDTAPAPAAMPSLEDIQHWTWVLGRAQQMMLEAGMERAPQAVAGLGDPAEAIDRIGAFWSAGIDLWTRFLQPAAPVAPDATRAPDKRFKAEAWHSNPLFDWIRQSYLSISDQMLQQVDAMDGLDARQRDQLRFATRAIVDAMSPTNFAFTNPEVIERTIETRGENLLKGLANMLADIGRGQLTHTDASAFEIGRNVANTPGKVIHRTPLFELIHYTPTTETVLKVPLVIFPPWINRFYILDLSPEKSFIRWALDQGVSVFMVSWKSADATMADVTWDDYVLAQVEAIAVACDQLGVSAAHVIGYCVAGTTLAATLAYLAARGEADRVKSATFFTAQVDFSAAGDLLNFIDDKQLDVIRQLSPEGFLDGRYMAATFNLLRGRDLIWNYVANNYLLGRDYAPFDLLYWNGDTTNLPAKWHLSYLTDLYRDNLLIRPGALSIAGTPIDLSRISTPAYVQAGREDHIAPADSVWKLTQVLGGPPRFVLAGSGHIAGVVNPPAANKYQYWINEKPAATLDEFVAGATETRGSWWPDWITWLRTQDDTTVAVKGARIPGGGRKRRALEDAPGSYVKLK